MSNDMKWQMTWNVKWHETPNADASHQDDYDAGNASDLKYVLYSLHNEQCAIFVKCLLCEIWEVCMNMYCSGTVHEYEKCAWTMHGTGTGSGTGVVVLLGKWSESCFDIVLVCEILVIALSGEVARWITRVGTGEQQGPMRLHWHTPAWCPRHRMQVNWKRKHSRTRQSKLCGFCAFHYWNL